MDIAKEFADYLQTCGFGTVGTDIFVGQIPDETNGTFIVSTGGQIGYYVPINETVLSVYCKDTDASACISQLNQIKNFVHRMHSTGTSLAKFYSILVIGDVEDVARDLEYAKVYKITVQLINRDLSLIS